MDEKGVAMIVKGACGLIFFFHGMLVLSFSQGSFVGFLMAAAYACLAYLVIPFFVFFLVKGNGVKALDWVSIYDPLVILLLYGIGYGVFWSYYFFRVDDALSAAGLLIYYPWIVNASVLGAFVIYIIIFLLVKKYRKTHEK